MKNFGLYAQYYDLLYQDKDYKAEADFTVQLLKQYAPNARTILELGCGTGRHAEYLVEAGYQVCGIEKSAEMLAQCRNRWLNLSPSNQQAFHIVEGDLRFTQLEQKFDVVIALFHVMSYQTKNQDVQLALENVRKHLNPKGIFVFDFWYGPAVLTEKPETRVKRLENDLLKVTRIAEPQLLADDNIVIVNYEILAEEKASGEHHILREAHRMRYFFLPELKTYLDVAQFSAMEFKSWLSQEVPSVSSWGVYTVAKLL